MRRARPAVIPLSLLVLALATIPALAQSPRAGGMLLLGALDGPSYSVPRMVAMVGWLLPPAAGGPAGQGFLQIPQADPRYYLSAAQIDAILPLMAGLRENPYPSPAAARRIEAALDQVLTRDQKREWEGFLKAMEAEVKRIQGMASPRGGELQAATGEQRQAPRGSFGAGQGGGQTRRELTPEELRQQMVEGLIQRLSER